MCFLSPGELHAYLAAAVNGPAGFRFCVQPLVAVVLGVRHGVRDARQGVRTYGYDELFGTEAGRRELRRDMPAVIKPMIAGVAMDIVVLFAITGGFSLITSLAVGTVLIGLPYLISRRWSNRIMTRRLSRRRR